jgi:multidrug efflux pump subunit AcrA (membrane-fusion protein)
VRAVLPGPRGPRLAALRLTALGVAVPGAAIFGLAALLCCCRAEGSRPAKEAPAVEVRVTRARRQPVRPTLDLFGTVVHLSKADIYPSTEGRLETICAEEGMRVRKGQALATLSRERLLLSREQVQAEVRSKEALLSLAQEKLREGRKAVEARLLGIQKAEAELQARQAELQNASLVYSNKKQLFEAGGVAEGELEAIHTRLVAAQTELARAEKELEIQRIGFRDEDMRAAGRTPPAGERERYEALVEINTRMLDAEREVAEAELNAARSELRRIDMLLEETVIRSPIDGIVGARLADIGERADPETQLFTIFNTDAVYAQVEVGEGDLGLLSAGQEAEVRLEGATEGIPGRLHLISPYMNPQTRTARVRIRLANPAGALIPGMFVRVRIFTGGPEELVVVPEEALLRAAEQEAVVYVVRSRRLFRRELTPARREEGLVAVREGLAEGEMVVLGPSLTLREGMEVEVRR